jgi:hypothetical protein
MFVNITWKVKTLKKCLLASDLVQKKKEYEAALRNLIPISSGSS